MAVAPPEQSGTQLLAGRDFGNLFFWNEQHAGVHAPDHPRPAPRARISGSGPTVKAPRCWRCRRSTGPRRVWSVRNHRRRPLDDRPLRRARVRPANAKLARSADDRSSGHAHGTGLDWASVRRDGGSVVAHVQTGRAVRGTRLDFHVLATSVRLPGAPTSWGTTWRFSPAHPSTTCQRAHLSPGAAFWRSDRRCRCRPSHHVPELLAVRDPAVQDVQRRRLRRRRRRLPRDRPRAVRDPLSARRCDDRRHAALCLRRQHRTGDGATGQSDPSEFVLSPDRHSAAWMHNDVYDVNSGTLPPDADADLHPQLLQRRRRAVSVAASPAGLVARRRRRAGRRSRRQATRAGRRSHRHLQRSRAPASKSVSTPSLRRAIGWPGP